MRHHRDTHTQIATRLIVLKRNALRTPPVRCPQSPCTPTRWPTLTVLTVLSTRIFWSRSPPKSNQLLLTHTCLHCTKFQENLSIISNHHADSQTDTHIHKGRIYNLRRGKTTEDAVIMLREATLKVTLHVAVRTASQEMDSPVQVCRLQPNYWWPYPIGSSVVYPCYVKNRSPCCHSPKCRPIKINFDRNLLFHWVLHGLGLHRIPVLTIRPNTKFLPQYSAGAEPEPNSGSFSPRSVHRPFPAKVMNKM